MIADRYKPAGFKPTDKRWSWGGYTRVIISSQERHPFSSGGLEPDDVLGIPLRKTATIIGQLTGNHPGVGFRRKAVVVRQNSFRVLHCIWVGRCCRAKRRLRKTRIKNDCRAANKFAHQAVRFENLFVHNVSLY